MNPLCEKLHIPASWRIGQSRVALSVPVSALFSFATAVIKLRSSRLLDVRKMLLSAPAFERPNPGRERKRRESLVVSARARNGGRDFIKIAAGLVDKIHGKEIDRERVV